MGGIDRYICVPVPIPGPAFLPAFVVIFFAFNVLRREVLVSLVDIVGIVDHRRLKHFFS